MEAMDDSQGKTDTAGTDATTGHASSPAVRMHVSPSSDGDGSDSPSRSSSRAPDSSTNDCNSCGNNDNAAADGDGEGGNNATSANDAKASAAPAAAIVKTDAVAASSSSGNIAKTIAIPTTSAASASASASASPGGDSVKTNSNAKSKSRRPGSATTLGRDGHDYQHLASSRDGRHTSIGSNNERQIQQQPRSKWRPPTPERVRHQRKSPKRGVGPSARSAAAAASVAGGRSSSLLSNLGGGSSHDNTSAPPSSWFGGFFSSSSAPASASAGTVDGSSARFTALDNSTGMHPEQIATDVAIARANRRQQRRQQQAGMLSHGNKKRSKLIRKGDRHLLQQQTEGGKGTHIHADISPDGDGNVLMTQTDVEEAEDNFQDELSSDGQRQKTREERIRDECNFFYTGMDDDPTAKAAEMRRARISSGSSSRFGHRRCGGGGRGLMATDDDDGDSYDSENGNARGLYYAASGEDGAMGLDLEAGGYYSNNAEERDAFLARHESLNAYVKPPPSRHKRRGRFSGGIHTAVLPGDDHDLRLDQDGQSPASPSSAQQVSSSVYSSAVSSLHSLAREGGAMQLDEPPPSPSSVAIVSDSLRQSSLLYIHAESGMVQLRLPTDNVRLLMDPHLEPGILSVERVRVGKDGKMVEDGLEAAPAVPCLGMSRSRDDNDNLDVGTGLESFPATEMHCDEESGGDVEHQSLFGKKGLTSKCPWKDEELHYVLTVDDDLYRRLVKEMADSRTVCGIYYCCHTTEGDENRVSIGVALCVLFVVFTLLLVETIIHPH